MEWPSGCEWGQVRSNNSWRAFRRQSPQSSCIMTKNVSFFNKVPKQKKTQEKARTKNEANAQGNARWQRAP